VASLDKDLREAKDELIRLRSINLGANKDQLESLKLRESQHKDKVCTFEYCSPAAGKHFLRRATFKMSLLSEVAYILCLLQFTTYENMRINDNIYNHVLSF